MQGGAGLMKTATITPRLVEFYHKEVMPQLAKKFGFKNVFQVPRIKKPVITRAKKSIANFKIQQGSPIGCKVTLRGAKMYEFLDRLINIALPRIKDFRGVSSDTFDGSGNYALGLREQAIFPEIDADKVSKVQGMDVIVVTSARSNDEARELLRLFGMPFKKQG